MGTFARDTYNVVPTSVQTATGGRDVILRNTVTTLLKTTAAKSIITKFGFKNLEYAGDWTKGKPSGYTN